MGVNLSGIAVIGEIKPAKEIVHFYRCGNTLIFLDLWYNDVFNFSTICEAGLLSKADFSEDEHVDELIKLLQGRTFIVYHYSEWADLIDREYAVVFKNGIYSKRGESIYNKFEEIGLPFGFMFDHSYWDYQGAKSTYLANNI